MHFPEGYGYDLDHFRQLTIEKRKKRYTYGQEYTIFEKEKSSDRNEALDLRVYALAALHVIGPINWASLAKSRLDQVPQPAGEDSAPLKVIPKPGRPQKRNWATSW